MTNAVPARPQRQETAETLNIRDKPCISCTEAKKKFEAEVESPNYAEASIKTIFKKSKKISKNGAPARFLLYDLINYDLSTIKFMCMRASRYNWTDLLMKPGGDISADELRELERQKPIKAEAEAIRASLPTGGGPGRFACTATYQPGRRVGKAGGSLTVPAERNRVLLKDRFLDGWPRALYCFIVTCLICHNQNGLRYLQLGQRQKINYKLPQRMDTL